MKKQKISPWLFPATTALLFMSVVSIYYAGNASTTQTTQSRAQTAPTEAISPTFSAINDCNTNGTCPSTTIELSTDPSTTIEEPTMEITTDPNQLTAEATTDPCIADASTNVFHWGGHHHKKQQGAIGDIIQQLLELIKQLIALLGGNTGGIPGGNATPSGTIEEPTTAPGNVEPTVDPCEPTVAPTEALPTIAEQPTTGAGVTPTTGAAPTTGASTGTPNFMLTTITGYGWPDNSPPGAGIAHKIKHQTAGGTGTYEDPITFATATSAQNVFPPGIIVYIPHLQKYFIMEDDCAACNNTHMDLWVNSNGSFNSQVLACEDQLSIDHTKADIPIVLNAPAGLTVDTTPLFDTTTGTCNATNQL
jgi:3D (Asp-Asp-Asp) domain-containing protein